MKYIVLTVSLLLASSGVWANSANDIDPEAIISRMLEADRAQRALVQDLTLDGEWVEGEMKDGEFVEKVRILKKIFIKYLPDTALYREEYQELYKDGKLQSAEDRDKEAAERHEKKVRRKAFDISFPMLRPFTPAFRERYTINFIGVAPDRINERTCYKFEIESKYPSDSTINGDFYVETESFHLVRVDFSPAKLVKRAMFRLNELAMTIDYSPNNDDIWVPRQFSMSGKGKAMVFIGVKFSGRESYRNPVVNSGLNDNLFGATHGER